MHIAVHGAKMSMCQNVDLLKCPLLLKIPCAVLPLHRNVQGPKHSIEHPWNQKKNVQKYQYDAKMYMVPKCILCQNVSAKMLGSKISPSHL